MRKAFYLRHYEPAPCPPLDENARYNFTGQYLDDCSVLEVDAYDFEGNLTFRHFVNFDNEEYWTYPLVDIFTQPIYGYRSFDIKAGEWTQARIDTLFEGERMIEAGDHYSMTEELELWIQHETEQAVNSSQYWGYSCIYRLEAWERIAQAHKATHRANVRLENIREMFKDLPDKEEEILGWAKKNLLPHYALSVPIKKYHCITCTVCGKVWRRKEKPKGKTICPHCGAVLTSTRKKKIHEKVKVYETEPFANGGIIRHYDISNYWEIWHDAWTERINVLEVQRGIIGPDGHWKRSFYGISYSEEEGYTFADRKCYGIYTVNGCGYLYPKDIYFPNRTETDLHVYQALADDLYRDSWNEIEFIAHNMPECVEYLIKSGLKRIAHHILNYYRYNNHQYLTMAAENLYMDVDVEGKSLPEVLRLDSNMTARVKKLDIDIETLAYLQTHPGHISDNDIKNLVKIGTEDLMLDVTGLSVTKAMNYIAKQMKKLGHKSPKSTKELYRDYINMAVDAGMDPKDDIVRRCSDLRRRHDELVEAKEEEKNNKRFKKCKGVNKRFKPYNVIYGWSDDKFTVLVPRNPKEIYREGQILHHCVGKSDYMERHAAGKTMILFLRPADNIKEPWYTLEVNPKNLNIIQRYAAFDRQPELKTVDHELSLWKKEVRKRLRKPKGEVKEALERLSTM